MSSATLAVPPVVTGQEKPITRRDLPAAVARTVAVEGKGARLRGLSREQDKGKTLYEAEFTQAGHTRDVVIDETGAVVEIELQVDLATLPSTVQAGLKAAAGTGRLTKVESLSKNGVLVSFDAQVNTGGKRSEVRVGPDGKRLEREP